MNYTDYKLFVTNDCFTPEADPYYNLLRAGLELNEEYLELMCTVSNDKAVVLDELGDLLFWTSYMHADLFGFDSEPVVTIGKACLCDSHIKAITGNIKRIYRDKNLAKREELKVNVAILLNAIVKMAQGYGCSFAELMRINFNKLTRRLANKTIQGEGNR